ncbi:MAG: hypothetical protein H7Y43_08335 [Akkermansiaceae bacterium]|nr:hypothetical protein [Verrucomicrobiales bacterium]
METANGIVDGGCQTVRLPGSNRIRNVGLLLMLALLSTGCVSTKPGKFAEQVYQWVPLGTPAKQAEEIMTRKGFECHTWTRDNPFNPYGFDYLGCEREQVRLHDWSVKFFLEDGKVVRYGPIAVDDVMLKP